MSISRVVPPDRLIHHNEWTIVNTRAIVGVEARATPQIEAGFLEDTLLDPHAANPDFPGGQYSVAGSWDGTGRPSVGNDHPPADGSYRVVAQADLGPADAGDQPPGPTAPLGLLMVEAPVKPGGSVR